jgi:Protein of unknown function (DUF1084)
MCIAADVRTTDVCVSVQMAASWFLVAVSLAAAAGFLLYGGRLVIMLRRFPLESRGRTKKMREVRAPSATSAWNPQALRAPARLWPHRADWASPSRQGDSARAARAVGRLCCRFSPLLQHSERL